VFLDREEARGLAIGPDDPVFDRWAALLGDAVLVVGFAEADGDDLGGPRPARLARQAAGDAGRPAR
jgi:hypothetical protein